MEAIKDAFKTVFGFIFQAILALVILALLVAAYLAVGYGIFWCLLYWLLWVKTAFIFAFIWFIMGLVIMGSGGPSTSTYIVTVTKK